MAVVAYVVYPLTTPGALAEGTAAFRGTTKASLASTQPDSPYEEDRTNV